MASERGRSRDASKEGLTLLDALLVLTSASAIVLFIIWLAGIVAGRGLELSLPAPLERAVSGVWGWLTLTASSLLIRVLRGRTASQYLPWTLAVSLVFLASVLVSARFLSVAPTSDNFSVSDFKVNRVTPSCEGISPAPSLVPIELENGLYNLALLKQARVSVSTELQGFSLRHRAEFLNDGWYNNCRSWVADQMPAWVAIDLGGVYEISGLRMGSEHQAMFNDRAATHFEIAVSSGSTPGSWKTVYTYSGVPVRRTTEFLFGPILARHVRVNINTADAGQVRIDELEVAGRRPRS